MDFNIETSKYIGKIIPESPMALNLRAIKRKTQRMKTSGPCVRKLFKDYTETKISDNTQKELDDK
jgi:hypothetical protein